MAYSKTAKSFWDTYFYYFIGAGAFGVLIIILLIIFCFRRKRNLQSHESIC